MEMSTDVKPKFDKKEYMKKYAQEKLTCPICNGSYDRAHTSAHINTNKHQWALTLLKRVETDIPKIGKTVEQEVEVKQCEVCNALYVPAKWKQHCRSKRHVYAENLLAKK